MSYELRGFGVRLTPGLPSVVICRPEHRGPIDHLAVHRLGVGSLRLAPQEGRAEVVASTGDRGAVAEIAPADDSHTWRVHFARVSFALPPDMAILVGDLTGGAELRFAHIGAPESIPLPDGTALPYGDGFMRLSLPEPGSLPSSEEIGRDLHLLTDTHDGATRRMLDVLAVGSRARILILEVVTPQGEIRIERSYVVAIDSRHVVSLVTSMPREGAEVGALVGDAIAASLRAEPDRS